MRKKIITHLPSIILIFIASSQIYRVHTSNLSPWKGGGFGMFSTVLDRNIKLFLKSNDEIIPVHIPNDIYKEKKALINKIKLNPNIDKLIELRDSIKKIKWVRTKDELEDKLYPKLLRPKMNNEQIPSVEVSKIILEVWETGFKKSTSELTTNLIMELGDDS